MNQCNELVDGRKYKIENIYYCSWKSSFEVLIAVVNGLLLFLRLLVFLIGFSTFSGFESKPIVWGACNITVVWLYPASARSFKLHCLGTCICCSRGRRSWSHCCAHWRWCKFLESMVANIFKFQSLQGVWTIFLF